MQTLLVVDESGDESMAQLLTTFTGQVSNATQWARSTHSFGAWHGPVVLTLLVASVLL